MHVKALVSMDLQTSRAWVPHLHRLKTNWAQGQIYSWVEQQVSSGLSPNTARASGNQSPCETAVEISNTEVPLTAAGSDLHNTEPKRVCQGQDHMHRFHKVGVLIRVQLLLK